MTMLDERPVSARRAMIDSQLRVSGVNDPAVLAAMNAVAREDFVPEALKAAAYTDRALSLGNGHALPSPLVHGRLLVEAALQPGEKVLVVSPSGCLAALVKAMGAEATLVAPADVAKAKGTYDAILIDGAAEELPAALAKLLADRGRVVTGTLERGISRLAVGRKGPDGIALLPIADIGIPALPEFAAPKRWTF